MKFHEIFHNIGITGSWKEDITFFMPVSDHPACVYGMVQSGDKVAPLRSTAHIISSSVPV